MIPEPMPAPGAFAANMGWPGITLFVVEHLRFGAIARAMVLAKPALPEPEPVLERETVEAGAKRGL